MSSTKNHDEHAFVIDWIRAQLAPVCAELHIPDAPELLSTEQVWHLATPIHGVLRDPSTTALDLALLLHPTPAVNGTPFAAALDAITSDEPWRGFYGGAVGWCDDDGDGEWVVAIRVRRTIRRSARPASQCGRRDRGGVGPHGGAGRDDRQTSHPARRPALRAAQRLTERR